MTTSKPVGRLPKAQGEAKGDRCIDNAPHNYVYLRTMQLTVNSRPTGKEDVFYCTKCLRQERIGQ